jgi:apolipoprotein D and lipocalin family protein
MKPNLVVTGALAAICAGFGGQPLEPVTGFALNNYLGTWYEIARLPVSFENHLTHVTATYTLREDGKVRVQNAGIDERTSKKKIAVGKAKFARTADIGHLKVSFFGPFYADYIIVDLDSEYSCAMVASSKKYLWILSRKPELKKEVLGRLLEKAKQLGFDTGRLYFTPQTGG